MRTWCHVSTKVELDICKEGHQMPNGTEAGFRGLTGQVALSMRVSVDTHVCQRERLVFDRRLEPLCTVPGHVPAQANG